jgi:ATP-dependent Clp protease ATP-binding subunit ClpB
MTSNIASSFVGQLAEKHAEEWEIEAQLNEALKQHFRPEFLNRIDEMIIFHSLTREALGQIVQIQVGHLAGRLAGRRIGLEITQAARGLLAELGWDATYGARPLKRVIQQKLENPLANKILTGEIKEGDAVAVDSTGKTFKFAIRPGAGPKTAAQADQPAPGQPLGPEVVEGEVVE